jgi:hypothetical protein
MGTYGRGFTLDNDNENQLYDSASQGIEAGPFTMQAGIWGFNEVIIRVTSFVLTRKQIYVLSSQLCIENNRFATDSEGSQTSGP